MGSNDYGVSDETFCGGTPDDEPVIVTTCIHSSAGLCPRCQEEYDADPDAWAEYGDHTEGIKRWQAVQEEIKALNARATEDGAADTWWDIPF